MVDYSQYIAALDDSPFEETPVDLETFLGPDYLGEHFVLSEIQTDMVQCMSQIYKLDDLIRLYGVEEGTYIYKKYTKKEVIFELGKGAGKDFSSTVGCAYLVYKLLCLKDPAVYFGKVPGDAIDIINIAINAEQAKNVFFKGFLNRIKRSPWFKGRYQEYSNYVAFDKEITVYSGHSERESAEGLNLILAILDEISGFNMNNNSGNQNAKTSQAIYGAFRGSVDSRFPDYGKVALLSFPRYKGDFISSHYDEMVTEKYVEKREHTFVIDNDLPPTPDNTFKIEWDHDVITKYKIPGKIYAVKACSWEANPGRDVEDYRDAFLVNPADAYQRFACMPEGIEGGLFKNLDALQSTMMLTNPISSNQVLNASWKPDPEITYYLHADLAQKQDRCAVAMAHVDKFIKMGVYGGNEWIAPHVTVDFVVWWDNKPTDPLDLSVVAEWIIGLKRRGTNIGMVTTDRWNSVDFQKQLRSVGIKTDTLSVARREYDDMVLTVYDDRVMMPALDILFSELSQLRIINDKKVDHPRSGGKDLADATCGAIHNAIAYTSQYGIAEVDIHDYTAVRSNRLHEEKENEKPAMPQDIADFLSGIGAL